MVASWIQRHIPVMNVAAAAYRCGGRAWASNQAVNACVLPALDRRTLTEEVIIGKAGASFGSFGGTDCLTVRVMDFLSCFIYLKVGVI